jgi:hypothetical protein
MGKPLHYPSLSVFLMFAIVVTTASLAGGSNPSVTNYHAYIVLNLSWMNNTSTWIWFILHVYARTTATYKPVSPTWRKWLLSLWQSIKDLREGEIAASAALAATRDAEEAAPQRAEPEAVVVQPRDAPAEEKIQATEQSAQVITDSEREADGKRAKTEERAVDETEASGGGSSRESAKQDAGASQQNGGQQGGTTGSGKKRRLQLWSASIERFWLSKNMLYLRVVTRFLTIAPVLTLGSIHLSLMAGLGLWLWSDPVNFGHGIVGCTPGLTIFGSSSFFTSQHLRIFSLIMYSILLVPGLNLFPPFAFFLFLHITYSRVRAVFRVSCESLSGNSTHYRQDKRKVENKDNRLERFVKTVFLFVGLLVLFLVNILFVIDTERTLRHNKDLQGNEERQWGFGQILAMLLLVIPLRDAWIALRNIELNVQRAFDQAFRTVAEARTAQTRLDKLLKDGAAIRKTDFEQFHNALQYAAFHGNLDLVKLALKLHVDVNAKPGECIPSTEMRSKRSQ